MKINKWLEKDVIRPDRLRNISEHPYGWIDNNLLLSGFLEEMSQSEILLYGLYCMVADWRYGLSCLSRRYICKLLKMSPNTLEKTKDSLVKKDLIAYENRIFVNSKRLRFEKSIVQLLALPIDKVIITRRRKPETEREGILSKFGLTGRYGRFMSESEQDRVLVEVTRDGNLDFDTQELIKNGLRTGRIRAKK